MIVVVTPVVLEKATIKIEILQISDHLQQQSSFRKVAKIVFWTRRERKHRENISIAWTKEFHLGLLLGLPPLGSSFDFDFDFEIDSAMIQWLDKTRPHSDCVNGPPEEACLSPRIADRRSAASSSRRSRRKPCILRGLSPCQDHRPFQWVREQPNGLLPLWSATVGVPNHNHSVAQTALDAWSRLTFPPNWQQPRHRVSRTAAHPSRNLSGALAARNAP